MSFVGIHQCNHRAPLDNIQASALQWEALVCESSYREGKLDFAAEPRSHDVFIAGSYGGQVARL